MSAEIHWEDKEETILVVWYAEPPDINDVIEAVNTTARYLDSVDHPVCVIVDMLAGVVMPRNWVAYRPQFAQARGINHPNVDLNVFVIAKDNIPVKMTVSILNRLHTNLKVAHSIDEAHRVIARYRGGTEDVLTA